jgi:D-beta-D-heptose 7-phosphate kinase/D-beta-D-heptose 1-phosphate adenosyltransferase
MIRAWSAGSPVDFERVKRLRDELARTKAGLVFTNGCFSVIHAGHVAMIQAASRCAGGRGVVVAFNTAKSIQRIKGYRTDSILPDDARGQMLSSLDHVLYAIEQTEDTPANLLAVLRPMILCKGGTTGDIYGAEFVRNYGGQVIRLPTFASPSANEVLAEVQR